MTKKNKQGGGAGGGGGGVEDMEYPGIKKKKKIMWNFQGSWF